MGSFFLMSMPTRRHFFAAVALPVISAHVPAFAQEVFSEGKHYSKVSPAQPTRDPKRVEVLEFFAYSCSHCNAFEPALDAWQNKLPPDVLFRRIPVAFREGPMAVHQKLYFAIESLGLVDRLHHKVFAAMHGQRLRLVSDEEIGAFAATNGVDGSRLLGTMNSFAVASKVRQASQLADGYRIEGTPSIGVDGRWLTSGSHAGSNAKSLLVAEHLIGVAKKAR